MWIVKVALSRPYTFIVLALLLPLFGALTLFGTPMRAGMPTDIFPEIRIPVIAITFQGDTEVRKVLEPERDLIFDVPAVEEVWSPLLMALPLQLMAYHTAVRAGRDARTLLGRFFRNGPQTEQLRTFGAIFEPAGPA